MRARDRKILKPGQNLPMRVDNSQPLPYGGLMDAATQPTRREQLELGHCIVFTPAEIAELARETHDVDDWHPTTYHTFSATVLA